MMIAFDTRQALPHKAINTLGSQLVPTALGIPIKKRHVSLFWFSLTVITVTVLALLFVA